MDDQQIKETITDKEMAAFKESHTDEETQPEIILVHEDLIDKDAFYAKYQIELKLK